LKGRLVHICRYRCVYILIINLILAFRTSGLNPNAGNTVKPSIKHDNPCSSKMPENITATPTCPNQNSQLPQGVPCATYKIPSYECTTMNVNAVPFSSTSNQGLNGQLSRPMDAALGNFNDEEQQIRINDICNSSQNLLSLHNTVCRLSKQLASAQANLMAAQVKSVQFLRPINEI
jgi:hypothetical protein